MFLDVLMLQTCGEEICLKNFWEDVIMGKFSRKSQLSLRKLKSFLECKIIQIVRMVQLLLKAGIILRST